MIDWSLYDFNLPEGLLADTPAAPRGSSRLFIFNTESNNISFDIFHNFNKYLPEKSFLVLNKTKVFPSRVVLKKESGGKIVALLLINEITDAHKTTVKALVDRKITVGKKLFFDHQYHFRLVSRRDKIFEFKYNFGYQKLIEIINKNGQTPIPPYLRKTPLKETELRKKYQTVFADESNFGSVAAPTASLHFTKKILAKLKEKKTKCFFVNLQVGLGTFAPITDHNLKSKKLHEEYFQINSADFSAMNKLRSEGFSLIASGTTTARALESKVKDCEDYQSQKTGLFIFPPYKFRMIDCLITNFHLPRSSLMMLVEAFLQFKHSKKHLLELYNIAIKEKFRFYSFGDAMLIL